MKNKTNGIQVVISLDDVEITDHRPYVDWEQRRYEIAKDCTANLVDTLSNAIQQDWKDIQSAGLRDHSTTLDSLEEYYAKYAAHIAVKFADELIKQLKGE